MIKIQKNGLSGLDLTEVEKLRRWIEYTPGCYLSKLLDENVSEKHEYDVFTLLVIKKLYKLIEKIEGKLDLNDRHFNLSIHSLQQDKEYERYVGCIPKFDINYYVDLKLSDNQKKFAYEFMKGCNKENSREMMEYAEKKMKNTEEDSNYFVGSYMVELLRHHPESDYILSSKNLEKERNRINRDIKKKMEIYEEKRKESEKFIENWDRYFMAKDAEMSESIYKYLTRKNSR